MLEVKQLQEHEFTLFLDALSLQGWEIQNIHLSSLFKVFQNDFFIARKDTKVIGFISALKYTYNFGFISNFIILEEFRSLGYGKELFNYALEHLKNCQITLECKKNQQAFYKAFDFTYYYDSVYYLYEVGEALTSSLKTTSHLDKEKFIAYHEALLPQKYIHHLSNVAQDQKSDFMAIYNENTLSSYGMCFNYKDGYKIILSAKTYEENVALFSSLTKKFKKETKVYMEATVLETELMNLVEDLGMQEHSRMSKMYNKVL